MGGKVGKAAVAEMGMKLCFSSAPDPTLTQPGQYLTPAPSQPLRWLQGWSSFEGQAKPLVKAAKTLGGLA